MTHSSRFSPAGVMAYPRDSNASQHELATQLCLTRKLAELLQCQVLEPYQGDSARPGAAPYYVPDQTLITPVHAQKLGISDETRFFGGMVPYDFVASKAITHGLWRQRSAAPEGWSHFLAERLGDAVLSGYTAFSAEDARQAGTALLRHGPIRIKPVYANAGRGQRVVQDVDELESAIAEMKEITRGVVLEENLAEVETYSVGWCRVGGYTLSYVGTQGLTQDNNGQDVYGGSILRCILDEPAALTSLDMTQNERHAVNLAMRYDAAVSQAYPSLIASRRNYDIALGQSMTGTWRAGVLEQSWRAGGASIAEASALLHLAHHPDCREISAYTQERYGPASEQPDPGDLVFHGQDSQVGWLTKTGGIVRENDGGS
ncbi:DUF3182 family protein [Bordetella muralis]|uniref:DUF3182 family protein n=1 Tax=Bordetella muralis TaxID=1649130 RepID=UPI0039F05E5D